MIVGIICGPTGVGKSNIAYHIALEKGYEIISADSRQIYKRLQIGTSSPNPEWNQKVPHLLVNFLELDQPFSSNEYRARVIELLRMNPDKKYLVVGGTGHYIQSLLYPPSAIRPPISDKIKKKVTEAIEDKGLNNLYLELLEEDPEVAKKIHPNDGYRITKALENLYFSGKSYQDFKPETNKLSEMDSIPIYFFNEDRSKLYHKINLRTLEMINAGWTQEVEDMLNQNPEMTFPSFNALGYRELAECIRSHGSMDETIELIQRKTRNYAKKQVTFFKNQFPEAISVNPIDLKNKSGVAGLNF